MKKKILHVVGPIIALFLFALALEVLRHELRNYHYHDIVTAFGDISAWRILLAAALTILANVIFWGYDFLAVRYVKHPLSIRKTALAAFLSFAFSNNIGMGGLGGGAVRYRLYSGWGLPTIDIAKIIAFCSLTFWLGFLALGGTVFVIAPPSVPEKLHFPAGAIRPLGALFLIVAVVYLVLIALRKKPVRIKKMEFPLPPLRLFVPHNYQLSSITCPSITRGQFDSDHQLQTASFARFGASFLTKCIT